MSGLVRAMALHALAYCERLFYLEEVEEIRVADERVYAGRTLHEALPTDETFVSFVLEDEGLGMKGKLDALRRRDGILAPYEHKRGRSAQEGGKPGAWPSDRLQVGAYALLLERASGREIAEGFIRYHADNQLVRVPIDAKLRQDVMTALSRAQELSARTERPPITAHEKHCVRCSLAPICLPEESRKAREPDRDTIRLFPPNDERQTLHIFGHATRVGRRGDTLRIEPLDEPIHEAPIKDVRSVSIHGYASVSAQALSLCAEQGIAVHWFGAGGWYQGTFCREDLAVQRRIRQYEALREPGFRLHLARKLVEARAESQLRFLLRGTRGQRPEVVEQLVEQMRETLGRVGGAEHPDGLLGLEGTMAAAYFEALPSLISEDLQALAPKGRSRRPPRDPFNALLSFGYALLLREVVQAIRVVGLDPAFGFYHRPRSASPPLALDLIELFRVPVVDMAVVAAVNRRQFEVKEDFTQAGEQVWLSEQGRKKMIDVVERRLEDNWRHPVLDYSLSYRRHIELETRLMEKEWSGETGLFARARLR